MAELETEFMTNPVKFLTNHCFSPPSGVAGSVIDSWKVTNTGNIVEGANGTLQSTVSLKSSDVEKQYATIVRDPLLPGALTLRLGMPFPNPAPKPTLRSAVPIWWLPWDSLALTRINIPAVPPSLYDPSEDEFPRFFITAGINGCSVLVEGEAHAPTVYHAGITGKLARRAEEFWLEQIAEAQGRTGRTGRSVKGLHSHDYMGDHADARRFRDWQNSNMPGSIKLEITNCFGSLIGVRFGRHWSFYLQKNAFVQDVEILKRSDVTVSEHNGLKSYRDRASNSIVTRVDHKSPRMLGSLKVGTKTNKTFLKYTNQRTVVLGVGEVFPQRQFTAEFDWSIKARF